jgi:hypothetical protein
VLVATFHGRTSAALYRKVGMAPQDIDQIEADCPGQLLISVST